MKESNEAALLLGGHRIAAGIENCLKLAGMPVMTDLDADPAQLAEISLAILVTAEDEEIKKAWLRRIEDKVSPGTLIAVNTETIGLDILQENALHPERVAGLNWTEPADQTFFLEIIANETTATSHTAYLEAIARAFWNKDPYVIHGNTGIRMRLLGALIREAFFLVQNGYADVEDVDRACRNDAGYYLPFAGNLRYMDLMGTYAYGMVMKDLNRELANDTELPAFFADIVRKGKESMEDGGGFYQYEEGEAMKWEGLLAKFSAEIHGLMGRYNHAEEAVVPLKSGSN